MWRWWIGLSVLFGVRMAGAVVMLPDVIVTPNPPAIDDGVSAVTVAHDNDDDAAETVSHLPGVVVTQMSGSGSDASVAVRGFGGDANGNTVFVVNGMSQVNGSQMMAMPEIFSPYNIDSVELLEESDGVLYGDHAVGGVVRVNTKPVSQQPNAVSIGLGSYDAYRWDAQVKTEKGPWSAISFIQTVHSNNYRDHNAWDSAHMRTAVAFEGGSSQWEWVVSAGDESLQLPGALSAEQVNEDRQQADSTVNDLYRYPVNSSLHGEVSVGEDWLLQTQLQWAGVTENGYQGNPYTSEGDVFQWRQTMESRYPVWLGSAWLGGVDVLTSDYQYDITGYHPDSNEQMVAVFGQSSTPIHTKTTLVLGQRVAWNSVKASQTGSEWSSDDTATATTIAFRYALTDHSHVSLRRATNFRFPTTDESAWTQNGVPLKTQTGTSYEAHWQDKRTHWETDVSVYDLSLDNEILYVPCQDSLYYGYNENLSPTERLGAHVMLRYRWSSRWEWQGRYDWVNAKIIEGQDEGHAIPFVAANQWVTGVVFSPAHFWQLEMQYRYMGQRYAMGDVDNALGQEPAYGLLDATVAYHRGCYRTALSLKNMTAVKYNIAAVESTNGEGEPSVYYYPAPRFSVMWSLTYHMS